MQRYHAEGCVGNDSNLKPGQIVRCTFIEAPNIFLAIEPVPDVRNVWKFALISCAVPFYEAEGVPFMDFAWRYTEIE